MEIKLNKIIKEWLEEKKNQVCLILHVIFGSNFSSSFLNKEAVFVGYDVGVCEEEKTVYSSIFNEILFGHLEELIFYKNLLNENFLFSHKSTAEKYVNLHDELSAQGRGVEDYEKLIIYEIWKHLRKPVPIFG